MPWPTPAPVLKVSPASSNSRAAASLILEDFETASEETSNSVKPTTSLSDSCLQPQPQLQGTPGIHGNLAGGTKRQSLTLASCAQVVTPRLTLQGLSLGGQTRAVPGGRLFLIRRQDTHQLDTFDASYDPGLDAVPVP